MAVDATATATRAARTDSSTRRFQSYFFPSTNLRLVDSNRISFRRDLRRVGSNSVSFRRPRARARLDSHPSLADGIRERPRRRDVLPPHRIARGERGVAFDDVGLLKSLSVASSNFRRDHPRPPPRSPPPPPPEPPLLISSSVPSAGGLLLRFFRLSFLAAPFAGRASPSTRTARTPRRRNDARRRCRSPPPDPTPRPIRARGWRSEAAAPDSSGLSRPSTRLASALRVSLKWILPRDWACCT